MSRFERAQNIWWTLKPVREVCPGWWKLRWRFVWGGTCNAGFIWSHTPFYLFRFSVRRNDWDNGWGRYKKVLSINLDIWKLYACGWFAWDHRVMESGPSDIAKQEQRPIVIPPELRSNP